MHQRGGRLWFVVTVVSAAALAAAAIRFVHHYTHFTEQLLRFGAL